MPIYKSSSQIKIIRRGVTWGTWGVITFVSIIIALILWYLKVKKLGNVSYLTILDVVLLPQIPLLLFCFARKKIIIKDGAVHYKNNKILIKDIKQAYIILKTSPPEFSLCLVDNNKFSFDNPFKVNLSPFSKQECQFLINFLLGINPKIETDEIIRKVSKGNFSDAYLLATKVVSSSFLKEYRKRK